MNKRKNAIWTLSANSIGSDSRTRKSTLSGSDEKMEWLQSERKRMWQIRRATQTEAYRAREIVKNEIMRQRVASKFNSKDLAVHVDTHLQHDLFTPKILQSSTS